MFMTKGFIRKRAAVLSVWLCLILLLLTTAVGCGRKEPAGGNSGQPAGITAEQTEPDPGPELELAEESGAELELAAEPDPEPEQELEAEPEAEPEPELPQIDENGSYTTKEDVALYLHVYGKLPSNFITKKEARRLGWNGGSLEDCAPGKCIGGDYYGNYEGALPDGEYHECDIGTLGKKKRGAKRLVYSDDGRIYYTGDHYKTFELLYGEESGVE